MPFNAPFADPALAAIKKAQAGVPAYNVALPGTMFANGKLAAASGVVSAIRDASAQSGVPFNMMMASAQMESGLNPNARANTSSATGLFQFIDQTWLDTVRQFGSQHGLSAEAASVVRRDGKYTVDDPATRQRILDLRKDPHIASALAGDHLRSISDRIGVSLGRPPDATEIYLGHLLGPAGASQMLQALRSAPDQSAGALLPGAAATNPTLFNSPDGTPFTVSQFMRHLRDRVGRAYASIGASMPQGPINLGGIAGAAQGNIKLAGGGLHRAPEHADPADAGASGWGSPGPRHARKAFQRQLMSTMDKVFNKLDQANHAGKKSLFHDNSPRGLPPGLLEALKPGGGGGSV
jgi:hypothetical protein